MNFQRGQDPKEALRIGIKANAQKVSSYYVIGKIEYDDEWLSAYVGFTSTNKPIIQSILESLEKTGKIDNYLIKRIFYNHYKRRRGKNKILDKKELAHPIEFTKDFDIHKRISGVQSYIQVRCEYDPKFGNIRALMPEEILSGVDLVFQDKLYIV